MFELTLSDEQLALRDMVRDFAFDQLRPAAKDAEATRATPGALIARVHGLGLAAPVGEDYGGEGVPDLVTYLMAAELLAVGDAGLAASTLLGGHVARFIELAGSSTQRESLLPRLAKDATVKGSVMYHEGFGRGPSELAATAHRVGDRWTLNGRKHAVLHPGSADLAIAVVRIESTGELAAFVLDAPALGAVHVTRDDQKTGKLGLLAAPTGSVDLSGVTVHDSARLPDTRAVTVAVQGYRLTLAALAIGNARAAVDYAIEYAQERVAFGKPIAAFQAISFPLVDDDMALSAIQMLIWDVATRVADVDLDELDRQMTRVVARANAVAMKATRDALQTLGGHGFITDHPVERWNRAAATLAAIDFDPLASDLVVA